MSKSTKIIAGLLIVAAIAGMGWLVVKMRSSDTQDQSQRDATTSTPAPTAMQSSASPLPGAADEYLVITEWGVKFKLPDNLQGDIYYAIEDDQNIPGTSVNLISRRLERQVPRCANGIISQGSAYNGFVSITREKEGDGALLTDRTPPALLIRDQYGYFNRGTYCVEDEMVTADDKAARDALLDSFKTTLVAL